MDTMIRLIAGAVVWTLMQTVAVRPDTGRNLIVDAGADQASTAWQRRGEATVELDGANQVFVVRDGGRFQQVVKFNPVSSRSYAVLAAKASSERIDPDGFITGLPYLYGIVLSSDPSRFLGHLQADTMRSGARRPNEWSTLWGLFELREGAVGISFELAQAERRGVPQNGSAARFDDVVVAVFSSLKEAQAFLRTLGIAP